MSERKKHILIVDDTPQNIQLVAGFLKGMDYQMSFATNGPAALDNVEHNRFDLILLDIMMPEMDGYEVCSRLKADPAAADVPVIFLTAKTDPESIVKGFEVGGIDYITKPFNPSELLARVKTHLRLKEVEKDLRELNAGKDKFMSIIAHDLRGPFGSIMGMLNLLVENFDDLDKDALKDPLFETSRSANNFYKLLSNLLDWSRLQRGVMECSPETLELSELGTEIKELYQNSAEKKNIQINNDIPAGTQAVADEQMIKTVLRNLLSNALKFTPAGGTIRLSSSSVEEGFVQIEISDTGTGMSEEDLGKLFRIDVHYSRKGTAGESGTGVGLVLCQDLVEKNGGRIGVESRLEEGTSFYFSLKKPNGESSALTTQ